MAYHDRASGASPAKRWMVMAAVALAALIAARLTFFRGFDAARWRSIGTPGDKHSYNGRRGMYLDLVLFHSLVGMSRQQVIDRLGPPSPSPDIKGYDMFYAMGTQPLSIGAAYLALDFENDRVARQSWESVR